MPDESAFAPLSDLISKAILFLDRSAVQGQVVAILASLLVAGLVSKRIMVVVSPMLVEIDRAESTMPRWRQYGLPLVANIVFPVIGIVLLLVMRQIWTLQEWFAGLLTLSLEIMLLYLVYRLFLGFLYALFPDQQIRRYHQRLFGPLFAAFVVGIILSQLADLDELGRIVVGALYGNPVTLGALLLATVGLYFWITGAWALQDVSSHVIKTQTGADTSNVDTYLTLGRYGVILAGLLIVFSALNLNPATVAAVLGGLAVGVSFGLREIVSNFVSGIWLLIERSVRPGDIIEVDGTIGTVVELTMRATMMRTYDGVLLIVPNQRLFTSTVKTFTHSDRSIRGVVSLRVSPENPAEQVMEIMLGAAKQHPKVLDEPNPAVVFDDFGPTFAEYRLTFWLADVSDKVSVSSELRSIIKERFATEEIELLPQATIVAGSLEGNG